jgi:carbamoyl-phosphate synthase small subunit
LEDGTVIGGPVFGAHKTVYGELVFNTNMTGYCEALTDPSYRGQILMMTYPLIGNYGVDPATVESSEVQVTGYVVREACRTPSHPTSNMGLDAFLEQYGIPGIEAVDTRMLTLKTRTRGTMRAALAVEGDDLEEVARTVRTMPFPDQARNLVAEVSVKTPVPHKGHGPLKFALLDCGVKKSIIDHALAFGNVTVFPWDATADDVLAVKPDGVIISNGPGDPAHPDVVANTVRTAKDLAEHHTPLFGICLGHQILGLAFGGKTYKLKFGHRGGNQPVKDLRTGRVYISSQNHGFAVDPKSLEGTGFALTHVNLNDETCEGIVHEELPILSVQYHPEAHPGPHDNTYLFSEFVEVIRGRGSY